MKHFFKFVIFKKLWSNSQAKTNLAKELNDFCLKHNISKSENVILACSGGVDSMALLFLLKQLEFKNLTAVIIDHSIRKKSAKQALQTLNFLQKNNINATILKADGIDAAKNLEENARNARYNLLLNYAHQNNIKHIFVAHHLNDQIETFLLRLERGSALNGICAMQEVSFFSDVKILRPLLNTPKQSLITFCKSQKIKWTEDESNHNPAIKRNFIRRYLQKTLGDELLLSRLNKTIKSLQSDKIALDNYFDILLKQVVITNAKSMQYAIKLSSYLTLEDSMRFRLVKHLLRENFFYCQTNKNKDSTTQMQQEPDIRATEVDNLHNFITGNTKSWIYKLCKSKVTKQKSDDDVVIYFSPIDAND
jgi:tRNA(Ile)-lysidine synthase